MAHIKTSIIQTEDAIQLASFVLLGSVGGTGMETDINRVHCQNALAMVVASLVQTSYLAQLL